MACVKISARSSRRPISPGSCAIPPFRPFEKRERAEISPSLCSSCPCDGDGLLPLVRSLSFWRVWSNAPHDDVASRHPPELPISWSRAAGRSVRDLAGAPLPSGKPLPSRSTSGHPEPAHRAAGAASPLNARSHDQRGGQLAPRRCRRPRCGQSSGHKKAQAGDSGFLQKRQICALT